MAYNITKADGTQITIPDGAIDTVYSVNILGQNASAYGAALAESQIRTLENFSNINPPAGAIKGQLWYDTNNSSLRVWTGDDPGVASPPSESFLDGWIQVGGSAESDVLPATPGINIGAETNRFATGYFENLNVSNTTSIFTSDGANPAIETNGDIAVNGVIYPTTPVTGDVTDTLGSTSARWATTYTDTVEVTDSINFDPTIGLKKATGAIVPTNPGINLGSSTSSQKFGTVFADNFNGTSTKAQYADLAERYHADAPYAVGTLVRIGGVNEITQTLIISDDDFFGVVSKNPAYSMNEGAGSQDTHPYIALAGRVPVRVIGKVIKGDRLISSEVPGVAIAARETGMNATFETLVGRALVNKDTHDEGLVEATVGAK